jgi:hypothetical protein
VIEFADSAPAVAVEPEEYQRLLGYPRDFVMSGRSRELAEESREWFARHGRPWIYARGAESVEVADGAVWIDGVLFRSGRLQKALEEADAESAFLVAVSAGPEAEEQAHRLWSEGKPDEYFFLEIYASAAVEQLITVAGARLCAWADGQSMAVLPHYSPGYSEWDIGEQGWLLRLIARRSHDLPGRLEVLDSGALRPKKSLLGVFGVTRHVEKVTRLADLVPCEQCSMGGCAYRRTPYLRARRRPETVAIAAPEAVEYSVNAKALERWARERLTLQRLADGGLHARFRYDGTTCTNMGRPLIFHYDVTLGPEQHGYRIAEQTCTPAADDSGYTAMCSYLADPDAVMSAISREKPLLGKPLNEVLAWHRSTVAAGCYCEAASREHKWGLVLETIHYALRTRKTEVRSQESE